LIRLGLLVFNGYNDDPIVLKRGMDVAQLADGIVSLKNEFEFFFLALEEPDLFLQLRLLPLPHVDLLEQRVCQVHLPLTTSGRGLLVPFTFLCEKLSLCRRQTVVVVLAVALALVAGNILLLVGLAVELLQHFWSRLIVLLLLFVRLFGVV